MERTSLISVFFAVVLAVSTSAQEQKDIAGAKDNPLISRLKGSYVGYYNVSKWDTYILPISKIVKIGGQNAWEKKLQLEGEVVRIQYTTAKENNAAFVYMNYLNALRKANWEVLFGGKGQDELGNICYEWQFSMFQEGLRLGRKFGGKYDFRGRDFAYLAARYRENDTLHYVMLYIAEKDNFTMINQDIIKVKNPDVGLVTAKLLTEEIDRNGHVALDGIFFETGKSILTDKSTAALKNISDYLKNNKNKKFFIVGHTDNVGDFSSNMALSENRAIAVRNELVANYGINPEQIKAFGVANLAPVSSNNNEEGKSRNRRVEIVEQ